MEEPVADTRPRIKAINRAIVAEEKRLRAKHRWLAHQDALGTACFVGSLAAMGAIARPVWLAERSRRTVAVILAPCAELANPPGPESLRQAASGLLRRLDTADRVHLALPARLGGALPAMSRDEALDRIAGLRPPAAKATSLSLPTVPAAVQHTYRIGPAGG